MKYCIGLPSPRTLHSIRRYFYHLATSGNFRPRMAKSKFEYVKKFECEDRCLPNCWLVVRLDGKGFHRFADTHHFTKPNDVRSLGLMTRAAEAAMADYAEIKLAYGNSDEYSFVLGRDAQLYNRRGMKIVTNLCSTFTAHFAFYWKEFFPDCDMQYPASFDGRIVLYPTDRNLRDYLSWRQADCHINNLYNTAFWTLVQRGGLTPAKAEERLRGSVSKDKNEIMFSEFGLNYNQEPELFRKGTVLVRELLPAVIGGAGGDSATEDAGRPPPKSSRKPKYTVAKLSVDIIGQEFWDAHPDILNES